MLFFPEGTRTKDDRRHPFKHGAFELAAEHGVRLIPFAVHGTDRDLHKHGLVLREHVDCHVEVLDPLDAATHDVHGLRDAARQRIAAALDDRRTSE